MKNSILFITILTINLIFAQNKTIDDYVLNIENTEHVGSVKSIFIERFHFYKEKLKIDTTKYSNTVFYDKKGNLIKRYDYWNNSKKPTQIIYYDTLHRILKVKRKHKGHFFDFIHQFFSRTFKFPDSVNIYDNSFVKKMKTINYFSDTLLVKQYFFRNDTLRYYQLYKYNSDNQLIKKVFSNTKNGYGIILDKSITGNTSKKYLSPNDSTIYKYQKK